MMDEPAAVAAAPDLAVVLTQDTEAYIRETLQDLIDGKLSDVRRMIVILSTVDGSVEYLHAGEGMRVTEMVGIIEEAKMMLSREFARKRGEI